MTEKIAIMNKFTLELHMQKAVRYHQSGELEKAQKIYEKILEIDPTHADALHLSGVIAHQKWDYELAADIISKAIQQNPAVPYYYNNLGEALRSQGKFEDAVSAFEKAINLGTMPFRISWSVFFPYITGMNSRCFPIPMDRMTKVTTGRK